MKEFKKVDKVFIKSDNTINKIFNRYFYCLISFIVLIIMYNLIWGSKIEIMYLGRSVLLSLIFCFIVQCIFNFFNKKNSIMENLIENHIIIISMMLGLFSYHSNIFIIIISSIITIIIKNLNKNLIISSSLYGMLIVGIMNYILKVDTPLYNLRNLFYVGTPEDIVLKYGSLVKYIVYNEYYLSNILSIISFIYLFYKKSIKYNVVVSYILTFSCMMLFIGLFNGMNVWYLFFQLMTGNILFLTVFCLSDYPSSPISGEGQILYGVILGIVTCILRFIIPELSVMITLLLGPLLLTKQVDKLSIKLKYNDKFYNLIKIVLLLIIVMVIFIISFYI